METPSTTENQLSIIERSLPVFQQAGSILKTNQGKTQKALMVGQSILDQWKAAWEIKDRGEMFTALLAADERSNKYLVNCSTALKDEKEARAVVTQIMDEMKKMFTACENDIDKSKTGSIPQAVQSNRDSLAQEMAREEKRKREDAEKIAAKKREAVEIATQMTNNFKGQHNEYLLKRKQGILSSFNAINLANFEEKSASLKNLSFSHNFNYSGPYATNVKLHSDEECKIIADAIIIEHLQSLSDNFMAEMNLLKEELIDKLHSKKSELLEADKIAKELEALTENARIAEEKRQREIFAANLENKAKLEEEARIAREAEAERVEKLRKEQEAAEEAKRLREEAEQERLKQEAKEASEKSEEEAELRKQSDQTMIMFDQEASLSEMQVLPDARQGYDITVLHPAGFVEIFQFWFQNEGKNLPVDQLGKTSLNQMKAFCEKLAHKHDSKIVSKFLKYEQSFKAVNKKPAKAA